jgi:hypothetical protein
MCQTCTKRRQRYGAIHFGPRRYKGVGGQSHAPASLMKEKRRDAHCTGGLGGMDMSEKTRLHCGLNPRVSSF